MHLFEYERSYTIKSEVQKSRNEQSRSFLTSVLVFIMQVFSERTGTLLRKCSLKVTSKCLYQLQHWRGELTCQPMLLLLKELRCTIHHLESTRISGYLMCNKYLEEQEDQ